MLADRIEEVLGERPSMSALRAAAAKDRRTGSTLPRPRVTVGMPPRLPATSRTAAAEFDVAAVEAWLAHHPRLPWQRAVAEMSESLSRGVSEEQVVATALQAGLPWRTVAAELHAYDGRDRSVAGIHKRYRHLTDHEQA